MQYMLLIYDEEATLEALSEDEQRTFLDEYFTYTEELRSAGTYIAGDALQPVATATTLSVRDGKTLTTDGPFAETKEQLGGYYLIEAESLDDALEWGAKIPSPRLGKIEVRPLMVFDREGAPAG